MKKGKPALLPQIVLVGIICTNQISQMTENFLYITKFIVAFHVNMLQQLPTSIKFN